MKNALRLLTVMAAAWTTPALAGDAVVPPLVTRGMDPLQTLNLTSLISSELDFLGSYDNVDQLEAAPSGFSSKCLQSSSCLSNIARSNGSSAVLAGAATVSGSSLDLYLVLFDKGGIVRSKEFTVENAPSVIADAMTSIIRQVVTGESTQAVNESEHVEFDALSDDYEEDDIIIAPSSGGVSRRIATSGNSNDDLLDDFDLDDLDLDDDYEAERRAEEEDARRRAEEEARRRAAEEEARRRAAEEEARRRAAEEEARRRAEAEARRRAAEEEARRRAEAEARRRAEEEEAQRRAAAAAEPEEEEFVFEFASSVDSVQEDDGYAQASYSDRSSSRSNDDSSSSRSSYSYDDLDEEGDSRSSRSSSRSSYSYDDLDEEDDSRSSRSSSRSSYSYDDLDEEDDSRSSRRYSDSSSTSKKKSSPSSSAASLTGRVGVSKFQDLSFITYGVEIAYLPVTHFALVGGLEAYSARRDIPEALVEEGQPTTQWNTILPINLGAQYRMGQETVRPYIGGDLLLIPGYVKDSSSTATGLRARLGVDFVVTDGFAFNLNGSAGFWSGEDFESVQQDLATNGLVPQISGGTVLRF